MDLKCRRFEEFLGDAPTLSVNLKLNFDLGRYVLAERHEGLRELIFRSVPDKKASAKGFEKRGFASFIGFDDNVEAASEAFDYHRIAELPEVGRDDAFELHTHEPIALACSTKSLSSALRAIRLSGPSSWIRAFRVEAAVPKIPSAANAARSSSLGFATRSVAEKAK